MISRDLIIECTNALLTQKADLLNKVKAIQVELIVTSQEKSIGDEVDQSVRLLEESKLLQSKDRYHHHLLEIEQALARIENGGFGICEETGEPIEENRLRTLPWTRLSIEGAEIREAVQKKFRA